MKTVWSVILRYSAVPLLFSALHSQTLPLGRGEPSFQQPSRAPGVDYVLPSEAEVKATLDRVRDYFVRSTAYRIIDTATGQPITDFSKPIKTAALDVLAGPFNEWDYPIGVIRAGMLHIADVTGDNSYRDYTLKNFDFMFEHQKYFEQQA